MTSSAEHAHAALPHVHQAITCAETWSGADEYGQPPSRRQTANRAIDAIDAALRELQAARSALVTETMRADAAYNQEFDRLLAERRALRS